MSARPDSWLGELRDALDAEPEPLTPERVCALVCERFQGTRQYIPQRPPPKPDHRLTPRQIAERYGIATSTAHTWARNWRR